MLKRKILKNNLHSFTQGLTLVLLSQGKSKDKGHWNDGFLMKQWPNWVSCRKVHERRWNLIWWQRIKSQHSPEKACSFKRSVLIFTFNTIFFSECFHIFFFVSLPFLLPDIQHWGRDKFQTGKCPNPTVAAVVAALFTKQFRKLLEGRVHQTDGGL